MLKIKNSWEVITEIIKENRKSYHGVTFWPLQNVVDSVPFYNYLSKFSCVLIPAYPNSFDALTAYCKFKVFKCIGLGFSSI